MLNTVPAPSSTAFFGASSPDELLSTFGSPLYVYNEKVLRARCQEMRNLVKLDAFTVCHSTKANANPSLLHIIRDEGLMADAMSPGEVALLSRAGFSRKNIVYVCNNVAGDELAFAAKHASIVSVDSLDQLDLFGEVNPGSPVMVRVNPGIGAGHHKKVITAGKDTKFGVCPEYFDEMRAILKKHGLTLRGLNQHVGSLFMDATSYLEAAAWLLATAEPFSDLEIIDFGGGFGIPYRKSEGQPRLDLGELGSRFTTLLKTWAEKTGYRGRFYIEPGRYTVAESGVVLGTVNAVKNNGPTRYVGTDIGFSVLARPMIYDAFHDAELYPHDDSERAIMPQTIAGNICESGDLLAKDRALPEAKRGDVIGILDSGAYGFSMSSNYTQRSRPAEVLVTKSGTPKLIRRRDTVEDLLAPYAL
jgi:diaminopimelate decarboxylase